MVCWQFLLLLQKHLKEDIISKDSFKQLFDFGNKLIVDGLIDTTYRNIYYLIIGKFFSAGELGTYDEHGIFWLNILRENDEVYGYIVGWSI